MKRGKALRRSTGLARGGALRRTAGLRARPQRSRTDPEALAALTQRSGGRCEYVEGNHRCLQRATDPHHRRTRTRAGKRDDTLENLRHLCRAHHRWVHDHPAHSLLAGWLLPSTT